MLLVLWKPLPETMDSILQTIESHDIFSNVLGKERMKEMTMPTTPQTMEQVTCLVMAFMATTKVKIWLAIMKIRKITCAVPKISRPHGPKSTSPASPML